MHCHPTFCGMRVEERPRPGAPLELRTGRTLAHFHSFYDAGRALPALAKPNAAPALWLSEDDAAPRGIHDGDTIRIFDDGGVLRVIASVGRAVPPGTVWAHDGWPGLNGLTSGAESIPTAATTLFPFSTGQAASDAWVEVERA